MPITPMHKFEPALSEMEFPDAVHQQVVELVLADSFVGVIAAADAYRLADALGVEVTALMPQLIPLARVFAYPPISQFYVGAVVQGASGDLLFGGNLEFPGMALNATVHAEQAAIAHAHLHGERGITALAVNGSPCGHCRQFLTEINNPDLIITTPKINNRPLHDLLPDAFTPASLGNETGLLDPIEHGLASPLAETDELTASALIAANRSYAPYSHAPAGAAVHTTQGDIISASYLENVAFNPSLSPLHGVLIAMRLRGIDWNQIQDVVLVERKTEGCTQQPVTEMLLATLGSSSLTVLRI